MKKGMARLLSPAGAMRFGLPTQNIQELFTERSVSCQAPERMRAEFFSQFHNMLIIMVLCVCGGRWRHARADNIP